MDDDVIIDAAHDVIHGQFPGINGFQQCTLVPIFNDAEQHWKVRRIPFQRTPASSVQIHHTGHSNWVISFQRAGDSRVFLLDSLLPSPELPASLQIQLAQIYGSSDDQLLVEVPHLSKQDMGLYAIANMLELCQGGVAKLKWMRPATPLSINHRRWCQPAESDKLAPSSVPNVLAIQLVCTSRMRLVPTFHRCRYSRENIFTPVSSMEPRSTRFSRAQIRGGSTRIPFSIG